MQSREEHTVLMKMKETRLICDREVPIQQQRIDAAKASFKSSLDSVTAKSHQTVQFQARLGKLKAELKELEDALVKALAVKTRKEAKRMVMMDSLSVARSRIEELKGIVEDQRMRKDEYASLICNQSEALVTCEEKYNQNAQHREDIDEAISWYNKVLGFRIGCGHGVKFIFTNINPKSPDEEYSFTIRHEKDLYTLLDCHPHLHDTKELIDELNRSNGLFKFVRMMRKKFQETVACVMYHQVTYDDQDTSTICLSAPISSVSTDSKSESPAKQIEPQPVESNRQRMEVNHGKEGS